MSLFKMLSNCRYVVSPFSNLEDLSWRLLLRKMGVHLCFTNVVKLANCAREDLRSLFGNLSSLANDRPLVVQLSAEDPDSLIAAVNGLKEMCDAVDINHCKNFSSDEDDKWNAWISCIQKVQRECEMPILCKLPFSGQKVDDTIKKGIALQEAGCKFLLLHKQRNDELNVIVTNKDWDAVKVICEAVSVPFILDVGSSSLWEIDKCIEYTGVQGVAVSDSLETNPALFCKKQPAVLDVVDQYLELCETHRTPLPNVKRHLKGFCHFYLSRFHGLSIKLADVRSIEDIRMLFYELKKEMAVLSKSELKSLLRLKRKKETYKRKHLEKREEKNLTKEPQTLK